MLNEKRDLINILNLHKIILKIQQIIIIFINMFQYVKGKTIRGKMILVHQTKILENIQKFINII